MRSLPPIARDRAADGGGRPSCDGLRSVPAPQGRLSRADERCHRHGGAPGARLATVVPRAAALPARSIRPIAAMGACPPRRARPEGALPSKPCSGRRSSACLDRVSSPATSTEPSSTSAASFDPPSATRSRSSRPPASRWSSRPGARPGPGSRTLPRASVSPVPTSRCRVRSCQSRRPARSIACGSSRQVCTSRPSGSRDELGIDPLVALLDGHRAERLPVGIALFVSPLAEGRDFRYVSDLLAPGRRTPDPRLPAHRTGAPSGRALRGRGAVRRARLDRVERHVGRRDPRPGDSQGRGAGVARGNARPRPRRGGRRRRRAERHPDAANRRPLRGDDLGTAGRAAGRGHRRPAVERGGVLDAFAWFFPDLAAALPRPRTPLLRRPETSAPAGRARPGRDLAAPVRPGGGRRSPRRGPSG